jgi:enoyl-CoA hydratase
MRDYGSFEIELADAVATIKLLPAKVAYALTPPADAHLEIPSVIEELRIDDGIRVIVLTGAYDGEFLVPPAVDYFSSPDAERRLADPYGAWRFGQGIVRCFNAMTECEKPIIAKVNGDAIGFGQSLMLGTDLILAREDAIISDVHMGKGDVQTSSGRHVGPAYGLAPGDGAGGLISLFMTPTQAKEYMMLCTSPKASELAEARIINRAVPADQLDAVTDDFVQRLLSRSAFALAWTKRILNRRVSHHINMTMDASVVYQQLNIAQVKQLGFDRDPTSLSRPSAPQRQDV